MSLRITDLDMTSTLTGAMARKAPEGGWSLSWLPGMTLGRDQAISGMTIAEVLADPKATALEREHLVPVLAAELGLTAHDEAITALSVAPQGVHVVKFNPAGDDEATTTADVAGALEERVVEDVTEAVVAPDEMPGQAVLPGLDLEATLRIGAPRSGKSVSLISHGLEAVDTADEGWWRS